MKKITIFLGLAGLVSLLAVMPGRVLAQTDSYAAAITLDGSNDVLVNGQGTASDYVEDGDTVNVTFTNNAATNIIVCSKGSSPQSIANGGTANMSVTVNGQGEFDLYQSSGNCQNGSGNPGYLLVGGADGSLSCSISSNQVWNVTGSYSNVPQSIYLYRGSTYVADIPAHSGAGSFFNTSVNESFSAQTTAATYYLYDGTSSSDELIGQATCAAKTVTTTKTPTTPVSTPTTTPAAGATTTTPSTPTTTPTTSTTQASTSTKATATPKATKTKTTKKVSSSNTALYASGGVIVVAIVALLVLDLLKIWTEPKKLLMKILHRKKK